MPLARNPGYGLHICTESLAQSSGIDEDPQWKISARINHMFAAGR
jgi:hypothetical protein